MNILFHSTAPWSPSSYSVLTKRVVPDIVKAGHKVTVSTWYGLQGHPMPWNIVSTPKNGDAPEVIDTVTVLPYVNGGSYGVDTMIASYRHFKCNVLITNSDVWVYPPEETSKATFCPWFPVDYDPLPDPVLKSLQTAIVPMVYSEFGRQVCEDAGVKARTVHCGADSKVYKPLKKEELSKKFSIPEDCDFLITMVAANKDPNDRKGFGEAIPAFAKFLETHPNAYLYLHTNWDGPISIPAMIDSLKIKGNVLRPDGYGYAMGLLDEQYMVETYNLTDVLLNPCKSEGFGLPIIEAQMCGTPVIVTDFATTEELFFAGWKLSGQLDWASGLNSWRRRVRIDDIVGALEDAYNNKDNRKIAKKARKCAGSFDTEVVFKKHWIPALKEIEELVTEDGSISVY